MLSFVFNALFCSIRFQKKFGFTVNFHFFSLSAGFRFFARCSFCSFRFLFGVVDRDYFKKSGQEYTREKKTKQLSQTLRLKWSNLDLLILKFNQITCF